MTLDAVDTLLDANERAQLPKETLHILREGLLSGLQYVYVGIGIIAIISFICILRMPKHAEEN